LSGLEIGLAQATEVAGALIGGPVQVNRFFGNGRNSRIWRVRSGDRMFALKQYPSGRDDPRDRLAIEIGALRLMEDCHIEAVPRVLGIDRERGYALLSWIDGSDVNEIADRDIDAAIDFLSAIHELGATPWGAEQPLASEACLSGAEIERQIEARLDRLERLNREGALIEFIENSLRPKLVQTVQKAHATVAGAGLDFNTELPQEWRSLVPADFGFHNCLRRSDGSLAFLDFEYFGWDDPVKLTADILLHPGKPLRPMQRKRFWQAALCLYSSDPGFTDRLRAYLPLFGLRWVLILLNEFIPERWQRRVLAGDPASWDEAKARQLSRARDFLTTLPEKLKE
jgi:hypothetical protein